VAEEAVVDDPHDRGADPVWPASDLYPGFIRSSVYLYVVLDIENEFLTRKARICFW